MKSKWRLPTIKELIRLLDYSRYHPALPKGHPFINVQVGYYWSSTSCVDYSGAAWIVYMDMGYVYYGYKAFSSLYVWPVRSGKPNHDVPARFTDTEDGIVTDNLTGLVWTKDAGLKKNVNWHEAVKFVKGLNL